MELLVKKYFPENLISQGKHVRFLEIMSPLMMLGDMRAREHFLHRRGSENTLFPRTTYTVHKVEGQLLVEVNQRKVV